MTPEHIGDKAKGCRCEQSFNHHP